MPRLQDTKKRILEVALKLFSERGIKETTVKDIAKEVGITEGAIYRHFISKDELVNTVFSTHSQRFYEELMSVIESKGTIEDRFFKLVHKFLNFCFENPQAFKFINLFHYLRAQEVRNFQNLPKDAVLKLIDEAIKEGIIKVRRELALAVLVGALERTFLLVDSEIIKREEGLEEELAAVIWKALSFNFR
ncbi:TetR/AcrR family transcriptional regulator [Thermocrinis sp.]|uniref:TetR/AcrR family transcriptional regulator n=1 Tax=Thermocrinis sp. TaxID=2024383 RepID=UPI002FDD2D2A